MTFGLQCNEAESIAIPDAAAEGGIDFLDTAGVYPLGGDRDTVGPHGGKPRDSGDVSSIFGPSSATNQASQYFHSPVHAGAGHLISGTLIHFFTSIFV